MTTPSAQPTRTTLQPTNPTLRRSGNWAAAIAAAAFAGLSIAPSARADIAPPGFTLGGPGPTEWTLNGNLPALNFGRPAIVGNELLLTTANNDQATSAWYNTAQTLDNFTASFTYNFITNTGTVNPADGFAFVLQNNGLTALGGGGGALGYLGGNLGNTSSVALAFDLWNNNNGSGSTGITRSGFGASGYGDFSYSDTTPVQLRNTTPVNINVAYRDGVFTQTLTQGAASITKSFNVNLADRVGSSGFVGFTGGTGGANAEQKITNFSLTVGNAPAVAPAALAISGVPEGGAGFFGIREVQGAPACCGNLAETLAAIQGAHPNRIDYTAPVVNLYDSGGRGRFFSDTLYKLDPDQLTPDNDTVNNIAVVTTGTIRVVTPGMYTFGVNSDDGFRLTIDGRRFERAFGQLGNPPINANGALEFNAGRGVNDSLGSIYLPAGDHKIQMLAWEGGGGGAVELYSSPGVKTAFDASTFTLIGGASIPAQNGRNRVVTVAPWTYQAYANATNVTDVTNAHFGLGGPATLVTTTNPTTVNFHDPQGSNTGSHAVDATIFPGDTGGDDNNFGGFAETTLTIDAANAGRYTFMMYTDDDSRFRILLAGVPVPLVGVTVGDQFDSDGINGNDTFGTGGCCFDQFGHYDLAAGTYTIQAAFHEGGGGAGFFIYGTQGDRNSFDPNAFQLVGANVDGATWSIPATPSLQLVPEPGSISMLGVAALGLMARRRRKTEVVG